MTTTDDHEEDADVMHASFLPVAVDDGVVARDAPDARGGNRYEERSPAPPAPPATSSNGLKRNSNVNGSDPQTAAARPLTGNAHESDGDDDNDDDERPRAAPRPRSSPFAGATSFATGSSAMPSRHSGGQQAPTPAVGMNGQPPPPQQSQYAPPSQHHQASPPPPPHAQNPFPMQQPAANDTLRVSDKCTARKCYRMQWEAEMNPRCRAKTTLNIEAEMYLFDGFYILCHDSNPVEVPQFEYTRGGVMCKIRFLREDLPSSLLPPCTTSASTTTPDGCRALYLLQGYLFQQLLGLQMPHVFQTTFGDPARATGDPSDICSDFHLVPRFISITGQPLLNKADLLAPHRIGFAVGQFLSVETVLGFLDATSKYGVCNFLDQFDANQLIDCVVGARINGAPGAFRIDAIIHTEEDPQPVSGEVTGSGSVDNGVSSGLAGAAGAKPKRKIVSHLKHAGEGARQYDGAKGPKKMRKWQDLGGKFMQVSPLVNPHTELLNPADCNLTGLRADIFELATAVPMVLKYIRNYKRLAEFEQEMGLKFTDKALLRQAFTHGSYVDTGMQNVNTVEATISRVRLGHVFENAGLLKRTRTAFLDDSCGGVTNNTNFNGSTKVDPEMESIAAKHLTADFKPEFHSKYLCSYERLEFLGDAVLSFLVASSAFLKLRTAEEGVLHQTRVDVANNHTLGTVARAANFEGLMLTAFDMSSLKDEVKTKIAADCFEALLGAVYKDQGLEACRALLVMLLERHDHDLRELYMLTSSEVLEQAKEYVETDRDAFQAWSRAVETRIRHRSFTSRTHVGIVRAHLWLQCMTHASFKAPQIDEGEFICTDASYERIEFLGDAVLQLLSSDFLVDTFPHHQEGLLTQARSSLVKNTRLAVVARQAGYEEFIRLGNLVKTNGNLYTEDVLADVFEATLGAVFLENAHDLGKVRAILEASLFPLIKEAIRRREWMNPSKVLRHHLQLWSRASRRPIHPAFRKVPSPNSDQHCVALYVNDFRVARASGRTIAAAQDAACRRALQLYGLRLHS